VDDEKNLPLCRYSTEQNRFLAVLADFGRRRPDLLFSGRGLVAFASLEDGTVNYQRRHPEPSLSSHSALKGADQLVIPPFAIAKPTEDQSHLLSCKSALWLLEPLCVSSLLCGVHNIGEGIAVRTGCGVDRVNCYAANSSSSAFASCDTRYVGLAPARCDRAHPAGCSTPARAGSTRRRRRK
jgi:hypothetical protein